MRQYLVLGSIAVLSACTLGAMDADEIHAVQANCSNVNQKIAMLEQEKIENNHRETAGIGNFVPMTAMLRFVTGRYDTNAKIATGEWGKMIDIKLDELNHLKQQCGT